MTMYESEFDRFLQELKDKNPQIEEQQRKNRLTWWDRPQDLDTWRERSQATVPQPSYVYFPLPRAKPQDDEPDSAGKAETPTRPA